MGRPAGLNVALGLKIIGGRGPKIDF